MVINYCPTEPPPNNARMLNTDEVIQQGDFVWNRHYGKWLDACASVGMKAREECFVARPEYKPQTQEEQW